MCTPAAIAAAQQISASVDGHLKIIRFKTDYVFFFWHHIVSSRHIYAIIYTTSQNCCLRDRLVYYRIVYVLFYKSCMLHLLLLYIMQTGDFAGLDINIDPAEVGI